MAQQATVTVISDDSAVLADLALLERAANLSLQVRNRLVDLFQSGLELLWIDVEPLPAVPAGEVRIRLQLCDPLRELLAAVRAGNVDGVVVQDRFHG